MEKQDLQIVQILAEDLETERENSANLVEQLSRLLFFFGKTLVKDFRDHHKRHDEGSLEEAVAIYAWLSVANKEEPEAYRDLLTEAVSHYLYAIRHASVERNFSDPVDMSAKDVVRQILLTRVAEDWLRPLLTLDSNGGIVVE